MKKGNGVERSIEAKGDSIMERKFYVAKTKTGKVTHIAGQVGNGGALILCGSGLSGTWRRHIKVGEVVNAETVTCKRCREKYGIK